MLFDRHIEFRLIDTLKNEYMISCFFFSFFLLFTHNMLIFANIVYDYKNKTRYIYTLFIKRYFISVTSAADLIKTTGMQQEPLGVKITQGRCGNDTVAYDIAETALLVINTNTLFPNGIPWDFSILTVAKPKSGESIQSKQCANNCI